MKKLLSLCLLTCVLFSTASYALILKSGAFENNLPIPKKFTCQGNNISPMLSWSDLPGGTRSLALIVHDPDAPAGDFAHWIVYNISPLRTGLEENFADIKHELLVGKNSMKKFSYYGPCPPSSTHRYVFDLYALDTMIETHDEVDKEKLLKLMQGHVLGTTRLMGTFSH